MKRLMALAIALLIVSLPVSLAMALNYDANGNLISGDGKFRVYNSLNQLSKIYNGSDSSGLLLEEYVYDPVEERILLKRVYTNNTLMETVIYVDENFVRVINSSGSFDFTYVKHEGQLIAQLNPDGSKIFISGDHLGSTSTITNSTGSVLENTSYTPYGEILSGGNISRYDYTGKEYGSLVGDYDYNFRKYNPTLGIFTQPDSLLPNVYDPQQLNRYSYARDNPYRYRDETGHFIPLIIGAAIVVVIAFVFIYPIAAELQAREIKQKTGQQITPTDDVMLTYQIINAAEEIAKAMFTAVGVEVPGVGGDVEMVDNDAVKDRALDNSGMISNYCTNNPAECPIPGELDVSPIKKDLTNPELIKSSATDTERKDYWKQQSSGSSGGNQPSGKSKEYKDVTNDPRPWWERHQYSPPPKWWSNKNIAKKSG